MENNKTKTDYTKMETMLIQVKVKTAKTLKDLRIAERESYDEIINRLLGKGKRDIGLITSDSSNLISQTDNVSFAPPIKKGGK